MTSSDVTEKHSRMFPETAWFDGLPTSDMSKNHLRLTDFDHVSNRGKPKKNKTERLRKKIMGETMMVV